MKLHAFIFEQPSYRLVVIFQEIARNHFWEVIMLMQIYMLETVQQPLLKTIPALSDLQKMALMQITEVKGHQVHL